MKYNRQGIKLFIKISHEIKATGHRLLASGKILLFGYLSPDARFVSRLCRPYVDFDDRRPKLQRRLVACRFPTIDKSRSAGFTLYTHLSISPEGISVRSLAFARDDRSFLWERGKKQRSAAGILHEGLSTICGSPLLPINTLKTDCHPEAKRGIPLLISN